MSEKIEIVDFPGRGPSLPNSRIRVQDLVPMFQMGWNCEQILPWYPSLKLEHIKAVEKYIEDHYEEVMEEDRQIREYNETRKNSPEVEEIFRRGKEKMERLRQEFKQKKEGRNGDSHSGG